ncbi:MAG: UvrD-helicase domain-containing protein [Endomicrobium sp.]|jgi:DNA helicase-2/ATP-dependent DNA helicase PcrA|nr:UvrD-helicase domain-containing protein [Endomicrobium sp.]
MKELLTKNLNSYQKEAVLCTEGPLIIFAGAGTGKTKVITHRIAYLLSLGVAPWSILAVTFTNKAATEMKQRVIALASQVGANVQISTFHSFCVYFLRHEASKANLNPNFVIYDFADQKNVIKDCLKELNLNEKKIKVSTIIDKISRAKDDLKYPSDMSANAEVNGDIVGSTIATVYQLYQKKLKKITALDFGDLIAYTVSILKQHPLILTYYQEKYKYIMVDEYQDTNHAQYTLIKLLAQKYRNICVVGDDDQVVYSWRGADINNILYFEKDYPNAKSIKLEQNYRSTPKILAIAHQVVKHNNARINKKLWTQNPDNGYISVIKAVNENDEAIKVADLIYSKIKNNKYNLSDFAVFYRTNAQSRTFEDTFRRVGIPYTLVGTLRFYDRAEIKNIMAYLKLIYNQNDNVSFKRVINIPKRGIGKTSLENLEKFAIFKNISIWQAIPFAQEIGLTKGTLNALNNFTQFIKIFINLKDNTSVKEITKKFITLSGYLKELETENTLESKSKIENIKELISAIDDFEHRSPDKSLGGYLTQISLISNVDSTIDESKGKATLMTIHLAKGLEFDNVFLCGLEEGLFPIGETAFNTQTLEEERRLMYVGMTRARKALYLCWAMKRTVYGKTKWNIPSRFIIEAGFKDELIKEQNNVNIIQEFNKTKWSDNFSNNYNYKKNIKVKLNYKNKNIDYNSSNDELSLYTPSEDKSLYKIGSLVLHPFFGKGKIIEKSGVGNNLKVVILFETGLWKKFLVRIANLSLLKHKM